MYGHDVQIMREIDSIKYRTNNFLKFFSLFVCSLVFFSSEFTSSNVYSNKSFARKNKNHFSVKEVGTYLYHFSTFVQYKSDVPSTPKENVLPTRDWMESEWRRLQPKNGIIFHSVLSVIL